MYNLAIRKCTSPPLLAPSIEYRTCWIRGMSQRGGLPLPMCVCVCVCVCSNANPLHYFMRFGFHARWIDGFKCGLFSNHAPLGQTHYVWDEYLYSVREKVEVRETVCLMLLCCGVRYDVGRKREGKTRCRLIACSSRKAPRGPPGLTSPSDGRIAINSTTCLLNIHTAEGFGM